MTRTPSPLPLTSEPSAAFDPDTMTRDQRSCLLYLETCAVDGGGLCEGIRMNAEDHEAVQGFAAAGLLQFNPIPVRLLGTGGKSTWTHIVRLDAPGWELAHRLRRLRAEKHGPHATECIKELMARGKFRPDSMGAAVKPKAGTTERQPEPREGQQ